jgi:hypothetical protein
MIADPFLAHERALLAKLLVEDHAFVRRRDSLRRRIAIHGRNDARNPLVDCGR